MKQDRTSGIALILGSLAMVLTMVLHPTGNDLFAGRIMLTIVVHTLAIASIPVIVFGFLGFSQKIGFDRSTVSFGFVTYSFGSVAVMCAGVINGLVAPALVRRFLDSDEATQQSIHLLADYGFLLNNAFAKVFVVSASTAMIFWSIAIFKKGALARITAIIGIIVGLFGILGILSGHLRMNVHGFGLLVFAQAAWTVLIGVLMIRSDKNFEEAKEHTS